jgi:hypothetical protein
LQNLQDWSKSIAKEDENEDSQETSDKEEADDTTQSYSGLKRKENKKADATPKKKQKKT